MNIKCPTCGLTASHQSPSGHKEFWCPNAHYWKPELPAQTDLSKLELRELRKQHWLTEVNCDHGDQKDQSSCACGWVSGWHHNVGEAVLAWWAHYDENESLLSRTPASQPDEERIWCMQCGKSVSTPVPKGTIMRAWVECPECIERAAPPVSEPSEPHLDTLTTFEKWWNENFGSPHLSPEQQFNLEVMRSATEDAFLLGIQEAEKVDAPPSAGSEAAPLTPYGERIAGIKAGLEEAAVVSEDHGAIWIAKAIRKLDVEAIAAKEQK